MRRSNTVQLSQNGRGCSGSSTEVTPAAVAQVGAAAHLHSQRHDKCKLADCDATNCICTCNTASMQQQHILGSLLSSCQARSMAGAHAAPLFVDFLRECGTHWHTHYVTWVAWPGCTTQ